MILLTLGYPVFIYIIIHSEKKDTWDKNISIISFTSNKIIETLRRIMSQQWFTISQILITDLVTIATKFASPLHLFQLGQY